MRLVFMGTPAFSVPTLRALHAAGHDIAAAYTRAPAASGRRGRALVPSPVHAAAEALGIEVRTPRSLRDGAEIEAFRALEAEAAVVVAYGRILPPAILDAVPLGCWNGHASLLPRWRGAAPIQRAVMAGDAETGIQIMRMEEGLDTGPIALTRREPIGPATTAGDLHDTLAEAGAGLMVEAMAHLAAGTLETVPQAEVGVTYAEKIDKAEARIDWSRPAEEVARHVNGLSPFPGAWTTLDGERVKLLRAEPLPIYMQFVNPTPPPWPEGTDFRPRPGAIEAGRWGVTAACRSDGMPTSLSFSTESIAALELQRAGGLPMSGAEFARGLSADARFE